MTAMLTLETYVKPGSKPTKVKMDSKKFNETFTTKLKRDRVKAGITVRVRQAGVKHHYKLVTERAAATAKKKAA